MFLNSEHNTGYYSFGREAKAFKYPFSLFKKAAVAEHECSHAVRLLGFITLKGCSGDPMSVDRKKKILEKVFQIIVVSQNELYAAEFLLCLVSLGFFGFDSWNSPQYLHQRQTTV